MVLVVSGVGCDPDASQSCIDSCAELAREAGGTDAGVRECIRTCGRDDCTEVCTSLGVDDEAGCRRGCADPISLSEVVFLVPVSAAARVEIERSYIFPMGVSATQQAPLNLCTLSLDEDEGVLLGNFQRALPRQTDDFFSFQYQFTDGSADSSVQWGLGDKAATEEWSSVPGGLATHGCTQEDVRSVRCAFLWSGEANGPNKPDTPQEILPASVIVECVFDQFGAGQYACLLSQACAADNECMIGICAQDGGCAGETPVQTGFPCTFQGGMGICEGGECIESPCGDCDDGDAATIDVCDVTFDCCDSDPLTPGCQRGVAGDAGSFELPID